MLNESGQRRSQTHQYVTQKGIKVQLGPTPEKWVVVLGLPLV